MLFISISYAFDNILGFCHLTAALSTLDYAFVFPISALSQTPAQFLLSGEILTGNGQVNSHIVFLYLYLYVYCQERYSHTVKEMVKSIVTLSSSSNIYLGFCQIKKSTGNTMRNSAYSHIVYLYLYMYL